VVISPPRALQEDLTRRVNQLGNGAAAWTGSAPPQRPSIIVVSSEKAISSNFLEYLSELEAAKNLTLIVYEEVHLYLTAPASVMSFLKPGR